MSEPGKNIINDTILSSAQSGDNKQTEALIRQYRNVVEAIAAKYINSPLEYDDIIQEGLIGLLAAIKTFNNSKGAVIEYAEEEIPEENGSISAEDYYIAGESVSMLANTLKENLSEYENEVLRLHIVGCNYSEIAKRLSKTPKSVDNALQRIKKKLSTVNLKTDKYN